MTNTGGEAGGSLPVEEDRRSDEAAAPTDSAPHPEEFARQRNKTRGRRGNGHTQ